MVRAFAEVTITNSPDTEASFIAGFVAGEGSFHVTANKYVFSIGLGATDAASNEAVRDFLGCGHVTWSPRRKPHHDDESNFAVSRMRDLLEIVVPFMDEHLPPSYKREQYLVWRASLLDYWEHRAKRVRPCTVEGCEEPRRAHGVCRRHLYADWGV